MPRDFKVVKNFGSDENTKTTVEDIEIVKERYRKVSEKINEG
jgi:hypothetical protein